MPGDIENTHYSAVIFFDGTHYGRSRQVAAKGIVTNPGIGKEVADVEFLTFSDTAGYA